jgi:acyl-CoA dehydrogenase family protein 10
MFFYKESEDWQPHPRLDSLKAKAKAGGLWNLFIPLETDPDSR